MQDAGPAAVSSSSAASANGEADGGAGVKAAALSSSNLRLFAKVGAQGGDGLCGGL